MELNHYLDKFQAKLVGKDKKNSFKLGNSITPFSAQNDFSKKTIGLVGITENRIPENQGTSNSPDLIRKYLYDLYARPDFPQIIDFGNIKNGETLQDTESAIQFVVNEMLSYNITPFFLGSKYFSNTIFNVLGKINQKLNVASVEPTLSLEINADKEHSYLEKIILEKNKSLYNFTNIGFQSYLVSNKEIELIKKLHINAYRLGFARSNLLEIEPVIRDTDLFIMDISSVKQSDAPGNENAMPNGFYSEEICQLSKFAGMANRIKVAGLFEVNPDYDFNDQTLKLSAQIVWHFIEGQSNWKNDQPQNEVNENFTEFTLHISGIDDEIIFLKNNISLRWWMKIPEKFSKEKENQFVACSYNDYQKARNNDVPDRLLNYINSAN